MDAVIDNALDYSKSYQLDKTIQKHLEDRRNFHTVEDYLNSLNNNKQFILQHLMKLYYYNDYTEKKGLVAPERSKLHWTSEVAIFYEINEFDFLNGRFPWQMRDALLECIDANPRYDKDIHLLKDEMREPGKFDSHKLPIISDRILKSKWSNFVAFYYMFISDITERLTKKKDQLNQSKIRSYIDAAARVNTHNSVKLRKVTERYCEFSYLEDDIIGALVSNGFTVTLDG